MRCALGADRIATGHYARVRRAAGDPARVELLKAVDATKDQSYFLHRLDAGAARAGAVPAGRDAEARRARDRAGARASRPGRRRTRPASASSASGRSATSSRATCRARPARSRRRTAASSGGTTGLAYYTLGQRQGLGIGGTRDGADAAVVRRRQGSRAQRARRRAGARPSAAVSARRRRDGAALDRRHARRRRTCSRGFGAKTRYRMPDARVHARAERGAAAGARRFDAPQWAPTPGQYLVLYDGDVCLGGGVIVDARRCGRCRSRRRGARAGERRRTHSRPVAARRRPTPLRTGCRRRSRRRAGFLAAPPPAAAAPAAAAARAARRRRRRRRRANSTSPPPPPPPPSARRRAAACGRRRSRSSTSRRLPCRCYLRVCSRPSM